LDYCWWTTFSVSLEGVTETEAASIHEFCTTNRYRARASAPQFLQRDCTARLPQTTRSKANDPQCPSPTRRPFLRVSSRGQGYEKPQLLLTSTVSQISEAANNIPQAPVGHRQPKTQDVQGVRENSADRTMKEIDDNLKKKLNGICRHC